MTSDIVQSAPREVRLRSVVHALGVVVAAFATGIALFVLVGNALVFYGVSIPAESLEEHVLSAVAQYVGFIALGVGYLWYRGDRDLVRWGWPTFRAIALMVGGFVALFALNLIAGIAATVLGLETAENAVIVAGNENPELFLYMIPITVLLVAPGEELVFRGIVQGWFRRAYGVVPGIVLASLLFGAVHIVALQGQGAIVYVTVAAALGLVLGGIYEYTENLLVPIVVHGVWNAFLFGGQYLIATGVVESSA